MRYSGNTYVNDWYAHLRPDAADGPGGLVAELPMDEPPMEPRRRAERREWLARREAALAQPELMGEL